MKRIFLILAPSLILLTTPALADDYSDLDEQDYRYEQEWHEEMRDMRYRDDRAELRDYLEEEREERDEMLRKLRELEQLTTN